MLSATSTSPECKGDDWLTPELIPVKPVYTKKDLEGLEHLNYVSGIPPFLRGPYSAMYPLRPWTIRQYAGFSTAAESNAFYRRNLAIGSERSVCGVSTSPTHRGYDAGPRARGRRRRQGRRVHLLVGGHESAFRGYSSEQDVRLHDDERRRAPRAGLLHQRRTGTGRTAWKRWPEPSRTTS